MSIERKIREMETGLVYGSADFFSGVDFAKHRAAQIAKEADEMMAEMASILEDLPSIYAIDVLNRYEDFKESTK